MGGFFAGILKGMLNYMGLECKDVVFAYNKNDNYTTYTIEFA